MARNKGLLHVNLNVRDMNRTVRFYAEALGFVLVSDSEEDVDLGTGSEPLRQVVLSVPQTQTILALTTGGVDLAMEFSNRGLKRGYKKYSPRYASGAIRWRATQGRSWTSCAKAVKWHDRSRLVPSQRCAMLLG